MLILCIFSKFDCILISLSSYRHLAIIYSKVARKHKWYLRQWLYLRLHTLICCNVSLCIEIVIRSKKIGFFLIKRSHILNSFSHVEIDNVWIFSYLCQQYKSGGRKHKKRKEITLIMISIFIVLSRCNYHLPILAIWVKLKLRQKIIQTKTELIDPDVRNSKLKCN